MHLEEFNRNKDTCDTQECHQFNTSSLQNDLDFMHSTTVLALTFKTWKSFDNERSGLHSVKCWQIHCIGYHYAMATLCKPVRHITH